MHVVNQILPPLIRFCRSTVRGKPGRLRGLAIYRACSRKPRLISGQPEVAIDPLLKLNGNCGGDRGPSIAPQAEHHKKQVAVQLLGLVRALRWRDRGGNVSAAGRL